MAERAELMEVVGEAAVRAKFDAEVRRIGATRLARLAGISTTGVYQAMKGGPLGIAIPAALGFARVWGYRRVGVAVTDAEPEMAPERRWPKYGPRAWRGETPVAEAAVTTSEHEMQEIWGRIDPTRAVPHVKPPVPEAGTPATNGDVAAALAEPAMGNAKRPRPVPVPIPIDEPPDAADVEDE